MRIEAGGFYVIYITKLNKIEDMKLFYSHLSTRAKEKLKMGALLFFQTNQGTEDGALPFFNNETKIGAKDSALLL